MKLTTVSRSARLAAACLFISVTVPATAQVASPGNGKPLPASAQKAPPFQGGSADLAAVLADITALKERVRRLEGNLTADEVAGTYTLYLHQTAILGSAAQATGVENLISVGTFQVEANGVFTYAGTESGSNAPLYSPGPRQTVNRPDSASGTWQYSAGGLQLTFDGGGTETWTGAVGGRLFIGADSTAADGTATLILIVKNN
jgi:hypothetical protein